MRKISIAARGFEVEGELIEKERPKTCEAILISLPLEGKVEIWKEEIYFYIPVKVQPENPTPNTNAGDVSYWPDEPAICIFFGKSQPVTPVNTFARIKSGIENFRMLKKGDRIAVKESAR